MTGTGGRPPPDEGARRTGPAGTGRGNGSFENGVTTQGSHGDAQGQPDATGSNRLAIIPSLIAAAHKASEELAVKAMEQAIAAGQLLIEARDALPHGGWLSWLKENVPFSERTAQNYMRLAKLPEAKSARLADLGLAPSAALRYVAGAARIPMPGHGQLAYGFIEPAVVSSEETAEMKAEMAGIWTSEEHDSVDGQCCRYIVTVTDPGVLCATRKPLIGDDFTVFDVLREMGFAADRADWSLIENAWLQINTWNTWRKICLVDQRPFLG
jgi:Protein of unknown function (DUF3102)